MNCMDLFAGCGGLSLGLKQSGYDLKVATDFREYASKTYQNYFQKDFILEDVLALEKDKWVRFKSLKNNIDLIAGGPPCQGFSTANRQRIKDDPRNRLYKSFLSCVNYIEPSLVLMENVKGVKKIGKDILREFDEIGFQGNFFIFNAKDFGIPQNRERIFFLFFNKKVFDLIDQRLELFENIMKDHKNTATPRELKDALAYLPTLKAKTIKNTTGHESDEHGYNKIPLTATNEYIDLINDGNKSYIYNHIARYNNDRDIKIFGKLPQGCNSLHKSIKDLMPYKSRNHIFKDKYFKLNENMPCKTITAHMSFDCNMYIHPNQARGLSPREAARVQSFPDDFEFKGPYTKWYEQIGNAVPPLLAKIISKSILKAI